MVMMMMMMMIHEAGLFISCAAILFGRMPRLVLDTRTVRSTFVSSADTSASAPRGDPCPVKSPFAPSTMNYSRRAGTGRSRGSGNRVGFRAWLRRQPDGTEWAEMDRANQNRTVLDVPTRLYLRVRNSSPDVETQCVTNCLKTAILYPSRSLVICVLFWFVSHKRPGNAMLCNNNNNNI